MPVYNKEKLATLIAQLSQCGEMRKVPLIRAAMADLVSVVMLAAGPNRVPDALLKQDRRPLVVLTGAEMPPAPPPDLFPQAEELVRWAGAMVVLGLDGQAEHYAAAVQTALAKRRLLMIETNAKRQGEWMELRDSAAPELPVLNIRTSPSSQPDPQASAPAGTVLQ